MPAEFIVRPIGHVRGGRTEPVDDHWGGLRTRIELDADRVTADSLRGLDAFSHLEVVSLFHLVEEGSEELAARRPRGNPGWPEVGIYAQRAKRRPNRLAVSRCRLIRVAALSLEVEALDAIDGTPVLDIKPWMAEFGPVGAITQPAWATELMADYYAEGPTT